MKVYFDLDYTLFDTGRFADDAWRLWAQNLNYKYSPRQVALQAKEDFYILKDGLYYYDYFAHLNSLFGKRAGPMHIKTKHNAKNDDYLYEDARDAIGAVSSLADVEILTFGDEAYQRYKAQLTGLDNIICNVTLTSKGQFLAQKQTQAILLDDRDLFGEMPAGVEFVRIERTGSDKRLNVAHTLTEAADIIKAMVKAKDIR